MSEGKASHTFKLILLIYNSLIKITHGSYTSIYIILHFFLCCCFKNKLTNLNLTLNF